MCESSLQPFESVRPGVRGIESNQSGAEDRRRHKVTNLGFRCHSSDSIVYPLQELSVSTPEHTSAENDGHSAICDPEATNGRPHSHHDLVGQLIDKLLRDPIALRSGPENDRSELTQTNFVEASGVDRLHDGRSTTRVEVLGNQVFQHGACATAVAGSNRHPQRLPPQPHAAVGSVSRQLAQRWEPNDPATGPDSDAVHAHAAYDCDTPI
jgi:hypothetical protein